MPLFSPPNSYPSFNPIVVRHVFPELERNAPNKTRLLLFQLTILIQFMNLLTLRYFIPRKSPIVSSTRIACSISINTGTVSRTSDVINDSSSRQKRRLHSPFVTAEVTLCDTIANALFLSVDISVPRSQYFFLHVGIKAMARCSPYMGNCASHCSRLCPANI